MLIDIHTHVWLGYDVDSIVRHMDGIGIDKVWLLTWEETDGGLRRYYQHLSIEDVYEAWQKYPNRFIPFYAPDPRRKNAKSLLREWVAKGIKGYGEHKVKIRFDNTDSVKMYRLCGELRLPVLFHMDVPLPPKYDYWYNCDIVAVEKILNLCPETIFIAHGPGWWREISKDADKSPNIYPEGKIIHGGRLTKMLEKYENLYADLSAKSGLNAIKRDPGFGKKFLIEFHKKILYGSDSFKTEHIDYLKSLGLPKGVFNCITFKNAVRLVS